MTLHFSPEEADIRLRAEPRHSLQITGRNSANRPDGQGDVSLYTRVSKPLLDITLTLIAAPVVLPLVLLMAALIMLDGHNPFYSQQRVGRQGRLFRMWKLRTMVHDADARLESYLAENPEARREWLSTQKLKKDPRITLVGRILRKTSLDELPQLWNVVRGDMSIVGPRPMMACQRKDYDGSAYFDLRPGITGLWQISDRNNCDFVERVSYDDRYARIISLRTDIWIGLRTIGVMIRATGY